MTAFELVTALRPAGDQPHAIAALCLDVIKIADWIVDLGPGSGDDSGMIVAAGPPESVAASPRSITGEYPRPLPAGARVVSSEDRRVQQRG